VIAGGEGNFSVKEETWPASRYAARKGRGERKSGRDESRDVREFS